MFLVHGGDLKRELRVSCYTDAGYLMDADDLKSQTGYVFVLNGGDIDWKSAKQSIFATSSAKAKYIAAFDASKKFYGLETNESGITKGARHFRAKVHYLREVIEFGDIKLEKVHTDDNLADPFTKALAFPKHYEHTKNIGMLPASSLMRMLMKSFRWYSGLKYVEIHKGKMYGFVYFKTKEDAERALKMNGEYIKGQMISVNMGVNEGGEGSIKDGSVKRDGRRFRPY
nr:hypothetical protein [Tanacetum cinerariifolium]